MRKWLCGMLAALLLAMGGCAGEVPEAESLSFTAMDTAMTLSATGREAEAALSAVKEEILRLDALFSPVGEESDIARLNATGKAACSAETVALLKDGAAISRETDGLFALTIAPLVDLWGFSTKDYRVPTEAERVEAAALVDDAQITFGAGGEVALASGAKVDLGGIAKGYASSRAMEIFRAHGIKNASVSLGGNVQVLGTRPDGALWRIGITDPADPAALCARIEAKDTAVVTSGGYIRYFEADGKRYEHILDPQSGAPAESDLASVSIITPDGTLADALATALYVMGLDKGCAYWRTHADDFEALFVTTDGRLLATAGIAESVEPLDGYALEVVT